MTGVEARNDGKRTTTTIVFPDGSFKVGPSNDELAGRIGRTRSASSNEFDLIVIGGGPTGLTTAFLGARGNAKVLLVEESAPGGQAGITERFANSPGFPDGVGGVDPAERMTLQTRRYGVEILEAVATTKISGRIRGPVG